MSAAVPRPDLLPVLVRFVGRLRAAGVAASPDRVHAFVAALDQLGAGDPADVYWAGRVTLCGDLLDVRRYDRVVAEVFGGRARGAASRRPQVELVRATGDCDALLPATTLAELEHLASVVLGATTPTTREREGAAVA